MGQQSSSSLKQRGKIDASNYSISQIQQQQNSNESQNRHNQVIGNMMKKVLETQGALIHNKDNIIHQNGSNKHANQNSIISDIIPIQSQRHSFTNEKEYQRNINISPFQQTMTSTAKQITLMQEDLQAKSTQLMQKNQIMQNNKYDTIAQMSKYKSAQNETSAIKSRQNNSMQYKIYLNNEAQKHHNLYHYQKLESKLFSLPNDSLCIIVSFLMNQYHQLVLVSPLWYCRISQAFEDHFVKYDNMFIKNHMTVLSFKNSFFSSQKLCSGSNIKNCFRLDRNFVAEVLPLQVGKTVSIRIQYEVYGKQNEVFINEYKFDVVKKQARTVWIMKEECKHNFNQFKLAYIQGILPTSPDDIIKISFTYYSSSDFVKLNSLRFLSPVISDIPTLPNIITPDNIQLCDKNRVCELEEIGYSWDLFEYSEHKGKISFDIFKPQLSLIEAYCTGVGMLGMKIVYKAVVVGKIKNSEILGVDLEIVDGETINEVKKIGLYQDLDNSLQLRLGDTFIFYLSRG